MAEHRQRTEITYDGTVRTGLVIRSERGYEAHSEGHGYLDTYATHRETTKAIFDRHRGEEGCSGHVRK